MEKRRSPRYSVSLDALVHPRAGRSWLCSIRDFCDSGMLLVEQSGTRTRRSNTSNAGDTVGIHFSVPALPKDRHFRLEGKIVRVMESGVGINFPSGMPEDALRALLDHANAPAEKEDATAEAESQAEDKPDL
ncbi:MAG: PilZ domain-containing protein, partial [Pseudomonadales bacterium]|nr:PilZ domain-containing protein [Pseudomonadales bacterium]